jgi:oligoendopeptidase F
MPTALPRSEVKKNQTWNSESVFESPEAFDAEVKRILESLPSIKAFQGHLGDSPETFMGAMDAINKLSERAAKVRVYATMFSAVDATNQQAAAMNGKATSALAQVSAATSFVDPELLGIGEAKLRGWLESDPRMKLYEHYFNDLFRKQKADPCTQRGGRGIARHAARSLQQHEQYNQSAGKRRFQIQTRA